MISIATVIGLIILALLVWFWQDAMKAREQALLIVTRACEQKGLQFLDQSVVLKKISLRTSDSGLRFYRRYFFEYYNDQQQRQRACVSLLGRTLSSLDLQADAPRGKVIHFPKNKE
jgi:hypothetical protein